jgi:hypothetical protein
LFEGSKRYPDARSRGALHLTSSGAWTAWEYTWYFHSSPAPEDFLKFVDVRCDALFEPLLSKEAFDHQAHHLEFEDPDDPTTPLRYRGVIYNEQKGILGHPIAVSWQEICRALFPGHPYALEHGGAPLTIPTITHEQLKAFHERHYHPANAYLLSAGDIDIEGLLKTLDSALTRVPHRPFTPTTFPPIEPMTDPVRYRGRIPIGSGEDPSGRSMVLMAWVSSSATDPYETFLHDLLVEILMSAPTALLREALSSSGLGKAVAETYDKYGIRFLKHTMATGLDGTDPDKADEIEAVIERALSDLVRFGIDDRAIDDAVNRIEFRRRTVAGPHDGEGGMTSFFVQHVNTPWLAGGDPLGGAHLEESLARFAHERSTGRVLEQRLSDWFLDNPHRALVIIEPDAGAHARLESEEVKRLGAICAKLTPDDQRRIVASARQLRETLAGRSEPPAPATRPVRRSVARAISIDAQGVHVTAYPTRTNGITYVDLICDLGSLPDELWDYVSLFARTLTDLRANAGALTGGLEARAFVPVCGDGGEHLRLLRLGGCALERHQDELVVLLSSLLRSATFTADVARLGVDGLMASAEQNVFIEATEYLKRLAGGHLRSSWALRDRLDGFARLGLLRRLAHDRSNVVAKLSAIRDHVAGAGCEVAVLASGEETIQRLTHVIGGEVQGSGTAATRSDEVVPGDVIHEARTFGQPTAFNCEVRSVPTWSHPDGAAILVAASLATRSVTGSVVRDGTAYHASVDAISDRGSFVSWSIRDPSVARTYRAFADAIGRLCDGAFDSGELAVARHDASVLFDGSGSVVGRTRQAHLRSMAGFDESARDRFLDSLDDVSADDVRRAALTHLSGEGARASLASAEMAEAAGREGYPFDVVAEI